MFEISINLMTEIRAINDNISIGILDLKAFTLENGILTKRGSEKAGTQFLLGRLLGGPGPFELGYTPQNKPFLIDRAGHISISHSHDKLVIIHNKKENTGIDIELIRDKVNKIQHKFLSPAEMDFAGDDTHKLITLWAAKEAMYKVYGLKEVDFSKSLFVEPFNSGTITGHIRMEDLNKSYRLMSETIDDYKMVYVLNEF